MLRYLSKKGDEKPFEAAVALAAPFDLKSSLPKLVGSVYEKYLIRGMVE